jgi:hypothetical protein
LAAVSHSFDDLLTCHYIEGKRDKDDAIEFKKVSEGILDSIFRYNNFYITLSTEIFIPLFIM